jgi:hypothetical protein
MTERTITETEAVELLLKSKHDTYWGSDIIETLFPSLFTPKKGEIIWVRNNDQAPWVLRVFIDSENGNYKCYAVAGNKETSWGQAKPQTPTEKGEG